VGRKINGRLAIGREKSGLEKEGERKVRSESNVQGEITLIR
jgi:hypothetical protein